MENLDLFFDMLSYELVNVDLFADETAIADMFAPIVSFMAINDIETIDLLNVVCIAGNHFYCVELIDAILYAVDNNNNCIDLTDMDLVDAKLIFNALNGLIG